MNAPPIAVCFALLACSLTAAQSDEPAPPPELAASAPATTLTVHPASIGLDSAREIRRFIVVATDAHGITRDVTAAAAFEWSQPGIARLDEDRRLHAVKDGVAQLRVRVGDTTAVCDVAVKNATGVPEISFRNDVIPALTRAGCNSGACHGSATGKNGFGLSLFGFDPGRDHRTLTRQYQGRRMDVADPAASLMLLKPTRDITHKGGKRFEAGSPLYNTLHTWIAEGAGDDGSKAQAVTNLIVEPKGLVLASAGQKLPIVVTAEYADGTTRDVTALSILSTSSDAVCTVGDEGVVTAVERGEAFVMARFDVFAEIAGVIVVPDGEATAKIDVEPFNEIDAFVHRKLDKLRLHPADVCDDQVFVRRAYLDVIGKLPTPDEARRFLADSNEDKRARLVDELLERPEFDEVWAAEWASVLRIEARRLGQKGERGYTQFLREAFQERVPFDQLARTLLTGVGSNFEKPEVNYYVITRDPKVIAEDTAQVFLGIRVQCAQCHNHPFERWTMDDYYGFAAFFGQIGRKNGEDPRERIVFNGGRGDVRNQRNNQIAKPRFLGGGEPEIEQGKDRRAVLAAWLTAPENPYFATNVANRVWARFFGRGLIDPPDDRRVSNPPSHPKLFQRLGRILADANFDIRALIRVVCASRTYQLGVHSDLSAPSTYAGTPVRRLSAEQLLDAIDQVTGVPTRHRGTPVGASAVQVRGADPGNQFLDLFGRPRRESVCTCDRRDDPTLNQVLHLINGSTIDQKIRAGGSRLSQGLAAKSSPQAMLEELFWFAYSRAPRVDEAERVLAALHQAGEENANAAWEDIYWAVLNSKEFLFQH